LSPAAFKQQRIEIAWVSICFRDYIHAKVIKQHQKFESQQIENSLQYVRRFIYYLLILSVCPFNLLEMFER